jgi:hypothetical protein
MGLKIPQSALVYFKHVEIVEKDLALFMNTFIKRLQGMRFHKHAHFAWDIKRHICHTFTFDFRNLRDKKGVEQNFFSKNAMTSKAAC